MQRPILFGFLAITLLSGVNPWAALGQDRGPSTAEERARAVQVSKELRRDPTAASAQPDREWFINWLNQVPDITVELCHGILGELGDPKSEFVGALVATMLASEVAFVIENPKKAKDEKAIYYAGVDGALDGYQAMRKKDPNCRLSQLDDLLQKRAEGKLAEYIHEVAKKCK